MQISSIGSFSSNYLLTKKAYSAGSVLNRLVEQKETSQKLSADAVKKTLTKSTETTGDSTADVLVDSLTLTDSDLHNVLSIAQYATGNISSEDREKCQKEIGGYLNDIDKNGDTYAQAVKKAASENGASQDIDDKIKRLESKAGDTQSSVSSSYSSSTQQEQTEDWTDRNSWTEELGLSNLSVASADDAKNAVTTVNSAIKKVDSTLKDVKENNFVCTDSANASSDDSSLTSIKDSTSASDYVNLLKSYMLNDSTQTMVSQPSNYSSRTTATTLDIMC